MAISVFARRAIFAGLVFTLHFSAVAQGSLAPPGPPAPVMKSLDQVEARTAITNTAGLVTISQPGSYYLTHNLTVSAGDGIDIATNGVMLDLNGFTISSTAASATGFGIMLKAGLKNITIANGFIQGGVTNNGSGVYSGSGFNHGIYFSTTAPVNVLVSRVSVCGCGANGIFLGNSDSTVVESCTVRTVGSYGIYASTIKSSSAVDCGIIAIYGDQISDCRGQVPGNGYGIFSNATAQNCYGQSSGSGFGISGNSTLNCFGSSVSGTGLSTVTAQNCVGSSGSGFGVAVSGSATGCYGFSTSGTGLGGFIANSCHGATSTGTALNVTHNINSF